MLKEKLTTCFKEPLIQFIILGAAIFALYTWSAPNRIDPSEDILVTASQVQQLRARFERMRGRQPDKSETEGLIDDFVRETIYYREALALGLDQDDPVIRNRLRQKFAFLQDELNSSEVTEAELQDYYQHNKQKYTLPGTYSFLQIFLGNKLPLQEQLEVKGIIHALNEGADPATLGQVTLLPRAMQYATLQEITNRFGESFSQSLGSLATKSWSGPITSSFGSHLVFIEEKTSSSEPDFVQIKPQLERDLSYEKRKAQEEAAYQALEKNYRITVNWPPKESTENGVPN